MGDTFKVQLDNPNASAKDSHDHTVAVIYLLDKVDDTKNKLKLILTNTSGGEVTFNPDDDLTGMFMSPLFSSDVIAKMTVSCPPGWKPQFDGDDGGFILNPTSSVSLKDGESLEFDFTNIGPPVPAEVAKGSMFDFAVMYPPDGDEQQPPVFLTTWADQPQLLDLLEAKFVDLVQLDVKWNVKVNDAELWMPDKDPDKVFSNAMAGQQIRTRLAFCLTNYGSDLKLTTDSVLTVTFVTGKGSTALADAGELSNVTLTELSSNDWSILQPSGESVEWTLTPVSELTLKQDDQSYMFLLDLVLPNANPGDNSGPPCLTEMYVSYRRVPCRDGNGVYDPGFLAATIEKVAPTLLPVSYDVDPPQDGYDVGASITLEWSVFGVETLTLSYIDENNVSQNLPFLGIDKQPVTVPAWASKSVAEYNLMNGNELLHQFIIPVK